MTVYRNNLIKELLNKHSHNLVSVDIPPCLAFCMADLKVCKNLSGSPFDCGWYGAE